MIWDLQSDMLVNLFIRESYLNFLDSFMFFNKEIYSQTVIFTDKFKIVIVTVVVIINSSSNNSSSISSNNSSSGSGDGIKSVLKRYLDLKSSSVTSTVFRE